mmetsp:Transcript_23898/g.43416  ORF Transcript_23898/g.43416 Transcript_23898/m.43416 type:complete len:223 (+) Transcript_23898:938-1606(+)
MSASIGTAAASSAVMMKTEGFSRIPSMRSARQIGASSGSATRTIRSVIVGWDRLGGRDIGLGHVLKGRFNRFNAQPYAAVACEGQLDLARAVLARLKRHSQQRQDHVLVPAVDALARHAQDVVKSQHRLHPFRRMAFLARVFPTEPVQEQSKATCLGVPAHFGDRKNRVLRQRRQDLEVFRIQSAEVQRLFTAIFKPCIFAHSPCTRSISAPTPESLRTTCS